jgi:hypothetical protein
MEQSKISSGKRKKKQGVSDEGLSEVPIRAVLVLLKVYLWTGEGSDAPQSAFAMVDDLLSTSPCEVCDRSSFSIGASFSDTAQAVNAARRLWRLIQGFSRASKTGYLGGCFTFSSAEDVNAEAETQFLHQLPVLTRFHSGQLFFVGALCESARSIPGLQFETSPEEFNRPLLRLMPPVQMEDYVEEPGGCWAPAVERKIQLMEEIDPSSPWLEFERTPIQQISVVAPQSVSATDRSATDVEEIAPFFRVEKIPSHKFPLPWAGLACAAVVALATIGILVQHSKKSQQPTVHSVPVTPAPAASPKASVPPPASASAPASESPRASVPLPAPPSANSAKASPTSIEPNGNGARRDVVSAKRRAADAGQNQASNGDGTETSGPRKGDTTKAGSLIFTASEIDRMVAMADRDSGDGRFDDAIAKYKTVLKREPTNARAKEGLARAIRNRGPE